MNFDDYWQRLEAANPAMREDPSRKMTLTVNVFKEALRKAYDAGRGAGEAGGTSWGELLGAVRRKRR